MATTPAPTTRADIKTLLNAIASDSSEVRLGQALTAAQWDMLAAYMQPMDIAAGRILIVQGAEDRTLYFVESGMLTVHFEDATGKIRLAAVGAGAVIGEGGFFSRMARSASVQAGSACKLWTLSPMRFSELANRQPTVALALAMALGAIMARRMVSNRRKIAIT